MWERVSGVVDCMDAHKNLVMGSRFVYKKVPLNDESSASWHFNLSSIPYGERVTLSWEQYGFLEGDSSFEDTGALGILVTSSDMDGHMRSGVVPLSSLEPSYSTSPDGRRCCTFTFPEDEFDGWRGVVDASLALSVSKKSVSDVSKHKCSFMVGYPKLERGDSATAWWPNSYDADGGSVFLYCPGTADMDIFNDGNCNTALSVPKTGAKNFPDAALGKIVSVDVRRFGNALAQTLRIPSTSSVWVRFGDMVMLTYYTNSQYYFNGENLMVRNGSWSKWTEFPA